MVCGWPSSSSVKSSLVRLGTRWSCASRTVAKRLTTRTSVEKVAASWAQSKRGDNANTDNVVSVDISLVWNSDRHGNGERPLDLHSIHLTQRIVDRIRISDLNRFITWSGFQPPACKVLNGRACRDGFCLH